MRSLVREFEPSIDSIRLWVRQADLGEGRREDGLTTAEREELRPLRRDVREITSERWLTEALLAGPFSVASQRAPPTREPENRRGCYQALD